MGTRCLKGWRVCGLTRVCVWVGSVLECAWCFVRCVHVSFNVFVFDYASDVCVCVQACVTLYVMAFDSPSCLRDYRRSDYASDVCVPTRV